MASPFNNRDKDIIEVAVPEFKSGDMTRALTTPVALEGFDDPNTSMFTGLGWDFKRCGSLVLEDSTLKKAVRNFFQKESLDPLQEYSRVLH